MIQFVKIWYKRSSLWGSMTQNCWRPRLSQFLCWLRFLNSIYFLFPVKPDFSWTERSGLIKLSCEAEAAQQREVQEEEMSESIMMTSSNLNLWWWYCSLLLPVFLSLSYEAVIYFLSFNFYFKFFFIVPHSVNRIDQTEKERREKWTWTWRKN